MRVHSTTISAISPPTTKRAKNARSVTVITYPLDLDVPVETHVLDSLGGDIWLLPGNYHILAYTSDFYDLDGIFYYNMRDPFQAEAKTNQTLKTKDHNGVKSYDISEPDPLFAKLLQNVEMTLKFYQEEQKIIHV